jgi:hypothetical protein
MVVRAYLLVGLQSGCDREDQVRLAAELEHMAEVVFAETVTGAYDLLVTAESAGPIEPLVNKVEQLAGVRQVLALKANPIPARARMWHNLSGIPLSPGSQGSSQNG